MAAPTIVQTSGTAYEALSAAYNVALASPPTSGNTLVLLWWAHNNTTGGTATLTGGTAWSILADGYGYDATQYGGPGDPARLVIYGRAAGTSESGTVTVTPGQQKTGARLIEVGGGAFPPTVSSGTATITASAGTSLSGTASSDGALFLVGWSMNRELYIPADTVAPLSGNTELQDYSAPTGDWHSWIAYGTAAAAGTITVGGTPATNANINKWGLYQAGLLFAGTATINAQFAGTPTSGDVPLSVAFTNQSSPAGTAWSWNFGDSSSGTTQNPTHVYTSAGTYTVSLVVNGAATATRTAYIVATQPAPGLSIGTAAVFSDRAMSWRITRGASPEITGGASIGQASITVQNFQDDKFNPENESSPIAGDLVDGTPIWIGVNSDGRLSGTAVRGLFGGYITDVTPIPVPGYTHPPTVEIRAEDALGRLSRTRVTLPLSRTRSHGDLREEILDEAGITERTLGNEIETMPVSGADGFALSELEALNKATGTRHFIEPGNSATTWYSYVARDRQWHLSGTAQGTIAAGMTGVQPPSGWRRSADTVINQQRVTFTPVTFTPAQVTVWEADVLPFTLTGAEREYWIQFDAFVDSPTVDLTYSGATVSSTLTAFGDTARLVVSTSGTATISRLTVEGSLARRAPDQSYVAEDAVSQALPRGTRSGADITGDFVGTLASARGLAEHVVWRYADPQVRPTLTVTNWFPYQFDLDLFDLVSFSSTQLGVTGRLFEIVGLTHEGRHAGTDAIEHTTTYVLQECRVQSATNWFTTDTHAPDGSAITGY